jgi:hypothetical protein
LTHSRWVALAGAVASPPAILVWYLVARPPLNRVTKLALLLGIGVFPLATAGSGNYAGFEATKHREFCGSCHVMTPYQRDVEDPASTGLAAIHTRNAAPSARRAATRATPTTACSARSSPRWAGCGTCTCT